MWELVSFSPSTLRCQLILPLCSPYPGTQVKVSWVQLPVTYRRYYLTAHILGLPLLQSFHLLSHNVPWALSVVLCCREFNWSCILFSACLTLWISAMVSICCEKKLLNEDRKLQLLVGCRVWDGGKRIRDERAQIPLSSEEGYVGMRLYWECIWGQPWKATLYWDTHQRVHVTTKVIRQVLQTIIPQLFTLHTLPRAKPGQATGRFWIQCLMYTSSLTASGE